MTSFVALWDAGWIYRANRIVNWCPYHQTAISDLEVEHVEVDDALIYARYPFADGSGSITIATVRPATILADVAVAVHPDDPRYADAVGKEVVVPVVGRRVPVIADARVEPELRLGRAQDHARPRPDGLRDRPRPRPRDADRDRPRRAHDRRGLRGPHPAGGRRARRRLARRSTASSTKREQLRHAVATCERCHSRIEPLVSPQWWCAMDELAAARDRGAARPGASASTPRASTASRSTRSRTRPTGASRASSGGATRSRSGPAPTATGPAPGRRRRPARSAARPSSSARPTCSTPGSPRRSGRSRRSAGPSGRPSSRATTRATSTSPRARSSASGRTG